MFFLIRFLAIVSVIFYYSPERGGGDAVEAMALPNFAASLDAVPEEHATQAGAATDIVPNAADRNLQPSIPDDIAGLIAREAGVQWQAIPEPARERLIVEIIDRMSAEPGSVRKAE